MPRRTAWNVLTFLWSALVWAGVIPIVLWTGLVMAHVDIDLSSTLAVGFVVVGATLSVRAAVDSELLPVARVILAYLLAAAAFAGGHFLLYRFHPTYYSIATAVLNESEQRALVGLADEAKMRARAIGLASEVKGWVEKQPAAPFEIVLHDRTGEGTHWIAGGVRVTHYLTFAGEGPPSIVYVMEDRNGSIRISGDHGAREDALADRLVTTDRTKRDYIASLDELLRYETDSLSLATKQLAVQKPEAPFNLADFVYFSLVTVTTVGYGDIVPNSTAVRLLVCCQILYGVAIVLLGTAARAKSRRLSAARRVLRRAPQRDCESADGSTS